MKITILLLVSRTKYLDRVIDSVLAQTHKAQNLLVIYEGHESNYADIRNRFVDMPFEQVRVFQSVNLRPSDNSADRRVNIANIHNQVTGIIDDTDWIFSIEDDGILPEDALEKLVDGVTKIENVGMITGVELGRWGIPYVGAWVADDIDEIKTIETVANQYYLDLVQPIDACGLYCALIRADYYKQHKFVANNGLGPDVNLGLFLRKQGFDNYIDWTIPVTHLGLIDGVETEINPTDKSRVVKLTHLYGSTWQSSR